ncbi:hypothetical protein BBJ28_00026287 [Nothophytophthora sp. Chile5]|nr:hypothetical protein BBJ28_00026287 [Nothophytophthora sp. Chile5]
MVDAMYSMRVLLGSMSVFALVFSLANRLSYRYLKVYRDFSIPEQGDWCSRVNSTIHALGVATGVFYTFVHQEWDADLLPLKSTDLANTLFSICTLPYLIYTLHSGCGMDLYLLTLFLMVEFAVIPLNITTFLEQLGYGKSNAHKFFFYTTYVCWFAARVMLPLYNIYVLWMRVIPEAGEAPLCTVPAALCGHVIAAFCVGVFVFVWTPDIMAKWRVPVLQMEEYPDYKLTMRQSMTPRSTPIATPPGSSSDKWGASYGSVSSNAREPQWTKAVV